MSIKGNCDGSHFACNIWGKMKNENFFIDFLKGGKNRNTLNVG